MRRFILLLTMIAATLVASSGVALAVNKIGTNGPDTIRGPTGPTISWAGVAATCSSAWVAETTCSVETVKTGSWAVTSRAPGRRHEPGRGAGNDGVLGGRA
jgi:type IV secretory pathway VirB2 component (pilin)